MIEGFLGTACPRRDAQLHVRTDRWLAFARHGRSTWRWAARSHAARASRCAREDRAIKQTEKGIWQRPTLNAQSSEVTRR